MREIRTSGSTRGRCVADSIRGSPSYSTGPICFLPARRKSTPKYGPLMNPVRQSRKQNPAALP